VGKLPTSNVKIVRIGTGAAISRAVRFSSGHIIPVIFEAWVRRERPPTITSLDVSRLPRPDVRLVRAPGRNLWNENRSRFLVIDLSHIVASDLSLGFIV
jgi:hypothetical protein